MTRETKLNLIYSHMHRDYRAVVDGKPHVLVLRRGLTILLPMDCLTDEEIHKLLPRKYRGR